MQNIPKQKQSANPVRVAVCIATFQRAKLLQGLLDALPPKATATVPFALERSLGVESSQKWDQQGAWIDKIEGGQLWIVAGMMPTPGHYWTSNDAGRKPCA